MRVVSEGFEMTIVTGLDQHLAQITAEWLDTDTGEVTRSRITPADRAGVRGFCEQARGQELEVALEATTGWRFVAEELRRVDAVVHLAEPAETAARRGNKERAKSDRADARHIRELLTIGRLPSRGPRRSTSFICGAGSGCGTRCGISVLSGSSGSSRCSITIAARSEAS
jgi:hypothetical protein